MLNVPGWDEWVKFIAAVLFIFFGIWSIKKEKINKRDEPKKVYGDIATVAIAFFIAEMGDKTKLATITLAAEYSYSPMLVLAGTTTGMLISDGIGIVAGVLLNRKLPEKALKIIAAALFVFFGSDRTVGVMHKYF